VNDAENVFIKMTVSGTTGGINSARVDNIQFNATATPEPTAIAGALIGVALLGMRRGSRAPDRD
jgi:lysozyme family protein